MNKKLTKKLERAEIEVARIDKELARLKRYVKEQGFSLRLVPDDHVTRREYSERQKEYVNRNMPIGYSCCSDEVFRIKTLVEEERPGHRRVIVFLKGLQNFSDELPKVVRDKDPFFPGDKGINFRSLKGYSLWVPNYSRNVCHPRSGVVEPLRPNSLVYRFRGDELEIVHSPVQREPLGIVTLETKLVFSDHTNSDYPHMSFTKSQQLEYAKRLLGLEEGEFCNLNGYVLRGKQRTKAKKLFELIEDSSVEVFARPNIDLGYMVK